MKALKTFRKVAALATGALMVGATLFGASAWTLADYPAFFIANPAKTRIVIGRNADAGDIKGAIDWAASLTEEAAQSAISAGGSGSSAVTVVGESATLSSGTDHIYLGQYANTRVSTLTDAELPTVLADGQFEDDAGTATDYEQVIKVGGSGPYLTFAKPPVSSQKNSLVHIKGDDSPSSNPTLTFEVTFDSAIDFDDSDVTGEDINLFGKSYTVGSASSSTNGIVLYSSEDTVTLKPGESTEVVKDGSTYAVTLLGVDTAGTKATVQICNAACDTEEVTEGSTKKILNFDVFADLVSAFNTEADPGFAVLGLALTGQANSPLYLSNGDSVRVGADKDDIEGTLTTLTGDWTNGFTVINVATTWADDDDAWLMPGESFEDPVFGVAKLDYLKLANGPQFSFASVHDDRPNYLGVSIDDDTHLRVRFEHENNEYTYSMIQTSALGGTSVLKDDDDKAIHVVEGAAIADEEKYIIRSGSKTFFFQVKRININAGNDANDDFEVKDLLSGETYKKNDITFDALLDTTTFNAGGQTFTVQLANNGSTPTVRIFAGTSSTKQTTDGVWNDAANVRVFSPFLPFGTSADHMVFFAVNGTVLNEFPAIGATGQDALLTLPTGTIRVRANGTNDTVSLDVDDDGTVDASVTIGSETALRVGRVVYVVTVADGTGANTLDIGVGIDTDQSTSAAAASPEAAVVVVGDEDNANSDVKNAMLVFFDTGGTNTELEVASVVSTAGTGSAGTAGTMTGTFDDSDYSATLDPFGILALLDTSDSDQDVVKVSYGKAQMAAHLAVSEITASIAGGSAAVSGDLTPVAIGDAEFDVNLLATYKDWNVGIVGGPCANSVAADVLGNPADCAEGFSAGKARIKLVEHSNGNVAMLAAGFSGQDTIHATTGVLKNWRDYRSSFTGMELEVAGTNMNDLSVVSVA